MSNNITINNSPTVRLETGGIYVVEIEAPAKVLENLREYLDAEEKRLDVKFVLLPYGAHIAVAAVSADELE